MNYLQEKYALSEQGAKDLFKGIIYSALAYISLILPVALLAYVLNAFLSPLLGAVEKAPTLCCIQPLASLFSR